jgi:hypothetical protein
MAVTLAGSTASLTSLTEINATTVELEAFAATVAAALVKIGGLETPVVHIVGASAVEAAVNWAPLCQTGASLVLLGPQALPPAPAAAGTSGGAADCVTTIQGLYSISAIQAVLGPRAAQPDMIMLHNADVYMPYWRRTLAELLQIRKPIVLTVYCEYEVCQSRSRLFVYHIVECRL